jgi:uncharacterized radical SAM superfamily Fe-S cluster-containing enzyme
MTTSRKQSVRDHIFHELARSLCPECRQGFDNYAQAVVDAQVLIRDGGIYLRKWCPDHGWHEALVSSDIDWYLNSIKYNKPGAIPYDFATTTQRGCPFDCGLCTEHQQHTCIGVIEITTRCNLNCPTCFADSNSASQDAGQGYDLTVAQVESILDRLLETEGQPEVVQISGGEPTIHPDLLEILEAARVRDIRYVMLNTNGLRLAEEPDFVRELACYEPAIYLQVDGLTLETHETLRGRDLRAVKQRALDNLAQAGLYAVLVATIVQGVNEHEIGDILRYGLEHPAVLGVSYQPVTYAGRYQGQHDPLERLTLPDVLHALEAQTDGLFQVDDFRPVPCPHPTCSASTYAVIHDGDVIPIPRILDVDDYLDFVTNRTVPDLSAELQPVMEALWSMAAVMGTEKTTDSLVCAACDLSVPLTFSTELNKENFFLVHVHGFMDEHTLDVKRLMKCCIHELLPDGRAVPFCAYNTLGYREQVRKAMRGIA